MLLTLGTFKGQKEFEKVRYYLPLKTSGLIYAGLPL